MTQKTNIYFILMACVLAVFVLTPPIDAQAQGGDDCIPGIPCFTALTFNDPWDDVIEPNEPDSPNAAKSTGGTCDADFMNQIYAKASLEAERENIMIETIISKPDSVLEYTCFEPMINAFSQQAPKEFSETTDFSTENDGSHATVELDGVTDDNYEPEADALLSNNPIDDLEIEVYMAAGLGDDETRMGNILENLVLRSLTRDDDDSLAYLDANFDHTFLGGDPVGLNNSFSGESDPSDLYACAQMNAVWYLAKCQNFNAPTLFYSFEALAAVDPRLFPQSCPGDDGSGDEVGSLITLENILLAQNPLGANAYYDSAAFVSLLPPRSYEEFLTDTECMDPIPTGVVVTTYDHSVGLFGSVTTTTDEHDEHICVNPGCFYDKDDSQCKQAP